jgi:antitoxin HicB
MGARYKASSNLRAAASRNCADDQKKRHPRLGSSVDDLLEEEGVLDQFQAVAVKEVIAWQIQQAMKKKRLSKNKMAGLMQTSRAQLDRLLDPERGNVTLETLQRAANVLGRSLRIELS